MSGQWLGRLLEVLGGLRPWPRTGPRGLATLGLALWWLVLALAVLAFVGRGARFIYVDF